MADLPIDSLPPLPGPLTGAENVAITQSGTTYRGSSDQIAAFTAGSDIVNIPTGHLVVAADAGKILRMTTIGPSNGVNLPGATPTGNGFQVTIMSLDDPLVIDGVLGDTVDGVPFGDAFCLDKHSRVTLTSDGVTSWEVSQDGNQRNSLAISLLAQAVSFDVVTSFSYLEVSTTVGSLQCRLQVVGVYQNARFIGGQNATVKNVGTFAIDLATNDGTVIGSLAPGKTYILTCKTVSVGLGQGTWSLAEVNSDDAVSNKVKSWGANDFNYSGNDGANQVPFPGSPLIAAGYPPKSDSVPNRVARCTFVLPTDFLSSGSQLVTFYFAGDTSEVGKFATMQVQIELVRPNNGSTIGGVSQTIVVSTAMPATALDYVTSAPFALSIGGAQAGDTINFGFARIASDGADTYDGNFLINAATYDYS